MDKKNNLKNKESKNEKDVDVVNAQCFFSII